ncbi:MAG: hypothetical protein HGA44_15230 [Cellulomonadaceae bacterium]|nr:hypothetical protein [Cellulomonadaceae bacterium]
MNAIFPSQDTISLAGYVLDDRAVDGRLRVLARWQARPASDLTGVIQMIL